MTDQIRARLIEHSPHWRFSFVMELCRETIHRRNSVRQITLADLNPQAGAVTWRGEYDKNGIEAVIPPRRGRWRPSRRRRGCRGAPG